MLIIYQVDCKHTGNACVAPDSAMSCVDVCVEPVCILVMLGGFGTTLTATGSVTWATTLCHHRKPLKWRYYCAFGQHTDSHTFPHTLYACIRRMQRNTRPRTNTPQSLSLCSLPQPNCAEDTSYLTTLPSPDTGPHEMRSHSGTNTFRLFLFLLSGCVRTYTQSSYYGKSHSMTCPTAPLLLLSCDLSNSSPN